MPVLTDPFISINGVDLSSHFTSADVPETADAPESTAFGVTTRRRTAGGLKDWTVTLEYNQDFDAGQLDATLSPLLATSCALVIRPDSAALGPANPERRGSGIMTAYTPIGGSVGELLTGTATFEAASDLTRHTS